MMIPADCELCGACCVLEDETYLPLSLADERALGSMLETLTHMVDGQRYMRANNGACVALEIAGRHRRCSIYDRRPELCREFQQASQECRSALVNLRRLKTAV